MKKKNQPTLMCMCSLKNEPTMNAVLFSVHSKKTYIYRPCMHLHERAHNTSTVFLTRLSQIV